MFLLPWSLAHAEPEPEPESYADFEIGLGLLHAPADPSELPAPTAGLLRFRIAGDFNGIRPFTAGYEVDVRGFQTPAWHQAVLAGAGHIFSPDLKASVLTGIGGSGRSICWKSECNDQNMGELWIPLRTSATWVVLPHVALSGRAGLNFVVQSDVSSGPVAPELVLGTTLGGRSGSGILGLRLEGGWRRELGADTWTFVGALGF